MTRGRKLSVGHLSTQRGALPTRGVGVEKWLCVLVAVGPGAQGDAPSSAAHALYKHTLGSALFALRILTAKDLGHGTFWFLPERPVPRVADP